MPKHRSVIGSPVSDLPKLLAPLNQLIQEVDFEEADPRRRFLSFQMVDARRGVHAVIGLISLRQSGSDVDAASVEVLARRVVEIALVCSYAVKEPRVVERFLKKERHSFDRSFGGTSMQPWVIPDDTKQLPDYREMAKSATPELVEAWDRLSHLSHPIQASPYSMVEVGLSTTQEEFFQLRAMPVVDDIGIALTGIIKSWQSLRTEET